MSDQGNPAKISRATIARKLRDGLVDQGWVIVGRGGSWVDAAEVICQYLERKGIEVGR